MGKDGILINLPEDYALTVPIHLLSVVNAHSFIANPHHMIILNPHSQLTLIEEHVSLVDETYMMNFVMTTVVDSHAALTQYKIQHEGNAAVHMAHHFIYQNQDSSVNLMNFSFGGIFSRDEVAIHLKERGAHCQTNGFYYLRQKNQYVDHHVDIDHEASHSHSEMLYKGIIEQSSRAVFNGRLHVHPHAQKIVAHQENHHLLLSEGAESYAKPELEIYADDVKCKHGATTGQINEEALFYLCSRGIAKEKAMQMLLQGFASSIIDRIRLPSVKSRIQSLGIK
jgi:Fe-S cluster assembly protein SufD